MYNDVDREFILLALAKSGNLKELRCRSSLFYGQWTFNVYFVHSHIFYLSVNGFGKYKIINE